MYSIWVHFLAHPVRVPIDASRTIGSLFEFEEAIRGLRNSESDVPKERSCDRIRNVH